MDNIELNKKEKFRKKIEKENVFRETMKHQKRGQFAYIKLIYLIRNEDFVTRK